MDVTEPSGKTLTTGERPIGRSPIRPRHLAVGSILFVLFTAAGITLLMWPGSGHERRLVDILRSARPWPLVAAAAFGLSELALGGTRLWLLARHVRPEFRWWDGMRAQLYNVFAAGLTPMQAGGGPAQFFMLRRAGLSTPRAVAVLTATWVGVMSAFLVFGSAGVAYLVRIGQFAPGTAVRALLVTTLVAVAAALLVTLFPGRLERLLIAATPVRRSRRGRRVIRAVGRYRRAVRGFARGGRRAWLANVAASWLMLLSKTLVGVSVLAALRIPADTLSAIARQAVQYAAIYVTPTPGGSGVAEVSSIGFMAGVVPQDSMLAYSLTWRAASAYLAIALGAVYVMWDVSRMLSGLGWPHRTGIRPFRTLEGR